MLADGRRMGRYRDAIERTVRAGDVVADLGTGLGVLALMAAQAGAARVYAIDNRPAVIPVTRRIMEVNGAADRVRVVEADVRAVELEEPVDVIVNELIGDFGTDEAIVECVKAFACRHLKPGGRIVPTRLRTFLVPVQYGNEFRGIWRKDYYGLDLRPASELACEPEPLMYSLRERPTELAPPELLDDAVFGPDMADRCTELRRHFIVQRAGVLQGFVGYFDATLAEGIHLNNYPCEASCHWQNWNWPISPPRQVEPGQRIEVVLNACANMMAAGWTLEWGVRQPSPARPPA